MAVVGVPVELHLVEEDAVGLLGVEAVLLRAAQQEVPADDPVGAVRPENDVLCVARVVGPVGSREAVLRGGVGSRAGTVSGLERIRVAVAGVEEDVLGPGARALDLEVALDALAELLLRNAVTIGVRLGQRLTFNRAALDVNQVLVVRARRLVLVRR